MILHYFLQQYNCIVMLMAKQSIWDGSCKTNALLMHSYNEARISEIKIYPFWLFSVWIELEKLFNNVHVHSPFLWCAWCLCWLFPRSSKTNSIHEQGLVYTEDVRGIVCLPAAFTAPCLLWLPFQYCAVLKDRSFNVQEFGVSQMQEILCTGGKFRAVGSVLFIHGIWKMYGRFQKIMK